MQTIEFKRYRNIEDYNFDCGFDLTIEDLKDLKDDKRNPLFDDMDIVYIKNHNGRLIVSNGSETFYITTESNHSLNNGYYIVKLESGYEDRTYTHKIYDEDDFGIGLHELILDVNDCDMLKLHLTQFSDKAREQIRVWFGDDYIPYNWKEIFKEMSKEEIKDYIKNKWYENVENRVKKEIEEQQEREKKKNETEIVEQKINNGLDFEIEENDKKISYDTKTNILTYTTISSNTPQMRLRFKSYDYFKNKLANRLYNIKHIYSENSIKDYLVDDEVSFIYDDYEDDGLGNGKWVTKVSIDFENCLFNNIKVAKAKLKFLFNRAISEDFSNKYSNETEISKLNKLSGIKVDILDIEKVKVDKLEFMISFSLHDRENFKVKFMNEEKIVGWNIIKENLTRGSSVYCNLSKKSFIKFVKDLGIPNETIAQQIKKTKIFHKLKGENQNGN